MDQKGTDIVTQLKQASLELQWLIPEKCTTEIESTPCQTCS